MNERDALFANVLNDPTDDTARLVLADWLDEHDEADLARFLRAGVTAARFRHEPLIDDPDYYRALADLAAVTTSGAPARWLAELGIGPVPLTHGDWVWDNDGDRVTVRIGGVSGVFARGLLSALVAPLADWYEFAPLAFAAWPLECGTVTDVPGLRFYVEAPTSERPDWRLSAALTVRARRPGMLRRLTRLVAANPGPGRHGRAGRWEAERTFPDRASLAERIAGASAVLVEEVRDAAGDLWPSP